MTQKAALGMACETEGAILKGNPIGSGDCTTAGLAQSWLAGTAMPEAARFGLCCGSANVRTTRPADFSAALARRLRSRCRLKKV